MISTLRRFLSEERGAAVYALALGLSFAAVATVGLAIDAGRAFVEHSRMQTFVDSLALAAAAELDGESDALDRAKAVVAAAQLSRGALHSDGGDFAIAEPVFLSGGPSFGASRTMSAGAYQNLITTDPTAATHVLLSAQPRAVRWSLTAILTTSGATSETGFDLSAWAVASSSRRTDQDVELTFAIDTSASMLIGATQADIAAIGMVNAANGDGASCGFACHIVKTADKEYDRDTYCDLPNAGIDTRLDAARDALTRSVQMVRDDPPPAGAEVYFDILTFANRMDHIISGPVDELPRDFNDPRRYAQRVDDPFDLGAGGVGDDDEDGSATVRDDVNSCVTRPRWIDVADPIDRDDRLQPMMTDSRVFVPALAAHLSAKLQATPDRRHRLILITDGVMDYDGDRDTTTRSGADMIVRTLSDAECQTLKDVGVEIAIIYTTYIGASHNSVYRREVAPIESDIAPSLRACASEGLFFEAAFEEAIDEAFRALTRISTRLDDVALTD